MSFIQAALTNATVLWNTANPNSKRPIKEFAVAVSTYYLELQLLAQHKHERRTKRSHCSVQTCGIRCSKICKKCDENKEKYFCEPCFKKMHKN